jgi:septum formation protein
MLRHLSGRDHEVYTGVTVLDGAGELCEAERSVVHFRKLSDEEIRHYIATGEPMDKAGAYGAQGKGALFVRAIEGDFFNVMGLPVCRLGQMLAKKGVPIL